MKDKNKTTEPFDQWEAWSQPTYRTGGTQPPKNNGGLIAFLLVLVIFLCGISTALGLMNIRMFRQMTALAQESTAPVRFSQAADSAIAPENLPLGFAGQAVPDFWQNYHKLPGGIYVTQVLSGSDACSKGIRPGDILLLLDQTPVPDTETLQALLEKHEAGDSVQVRIYRAGEELDLNIILQ